MFLILALVSCAFAVWKTHQAYGMGRAIATDVVLIALTLLITPIIAVPVCAIAFAVARNDRLKAIAEGLEDEPGMIAGQTYEHADPTNPYSPPGHGTSPQGTSNPYSPSGLGGGESQGRGDAE